MKGLLVFLVLLAPACIFADYLNYQCGSHVYADSSYLTTTYTLNGGFSTLCTVHFDRYNYGKISLVITGNSLDSSQCQVNVKDSSLNSKTNGNINSYLYFTRTLTSDNLGTLYLYIQGMNCTKFGLSFTLKQLYSSSCGSEFTCTNGNCVPQYDVCDGWNDCGDNSDETGCFIWNTGYYVGVSLGSVGFVVFVSVLIAVFYRRRIVMRGSPVLIPASSSNVVVTQSRW